MPRILVANDQEWTARSLESILTAEGYEVVRAFTGRQAYDRALDTRPDLIILDTQLPDISGPEVCRRLRAHPTIGWSVPVILTTAGSNGRNRLMEAMDAGAWDFATQPFDGPVLLARIRSYLNAKRAFDTARSEATRDPLTGLYNHRGLAFRLSELWADARRRRTPITCLVVSAHAPELADALESAQALAGAMADALKASVRASDAVARLSPLEFAIMAPSLDRNTALSVLDRFQRQFAAKSEEGGVQIRTGIATLDAADDLDAEELLRRAATAVEWATVTHPATVRD